MKEWKPGLIVTDQDVTREPENRIEKRIASYVALELRLINHRAKVELAKKTAKH